MFAAVGSLPPVLTTETLIGGVFRIISIIGEGGMGAVYLVDHVTLNRRFALKVLSPQLVDHQNWLRFQAEARTLAALNHPIFVKVYDLGIHEKALPFYSMDFLNGRSLEEILVEDGPMPVNDAIEIFIEILDGLAYAHRNGIVHRDLKPGNIMVCSVNGTRVVKVLDFGISKLLNTSNAQKQDLTAVGEIFGSPFYMSPEQCIGGTIDGRADIYSIGCTLFEALSGFVPYESSSALETMLLHQQSDPPRLSDCATGSGISHISPDLDIVLAKCLAKLPEHRYQSAKELALDLGRVRECKEILISLHSGFESNHYWQSKPVTVGVESRRWLTVFVAIFVLFSVFAAGVLCWNYWMQARESSKSMLMQVVVDDNEKRADRGIDDMVANIDSPEAFFKEVGKPTGSELVTSPFAVVERSDGELVRRFDFPTDVLIGYFCRYDASNNSPARGRTVYLASDPLVFCPTRTIAFYPQYMKRFSPGDIAAFMLYDVDDSDLILAACSNVPDVQELRLHDCTHLTPVAVDSLNRFKNLQIVDLPRGRLTDTDLARGDWYKNIRRLKFDDAHSASVLLEKLRPVKSLKYLSLRNTVLNASDYTILGKMSSLEELDISGHSLKPKDLRQLTSLNITSLNVSRCGLSENIVPELERFKNLKHLTILPGMSELDARSFRNLSAKLSNGLRQVKVD